MKALLILAATCAALCCVSPAEAKLFDRLRAPAPLTVTLAPAVKTLEVAAPETKRLGWFAKLKLRRALSKQLRKARVPAE